MRPALLAAFVVGCSYSSPGGATAPDNTDPDGAPSVDAPPGAWLTNWNRKAITIHASQVSAPENGLTEFPVAISLVDPEIAAIAQSGGADLAFTGADATTQLASDLERYDSVSGQLVVWVKLPVLASTTDTRLYLYYGNPAASGPAGEQVWTNHFLATWQLRDTPNGGGSIRDSTAANRHANPINMNGSNRIDGQVGFALQFNGNDEELRLPAVDLGNDFTISAWVRMTGDGQIQTILSNTLSGLDENGCKLFINDENTSSHRLIFESSDGISANARKTSTDVNVVTKDVWTHVAAVIDRSNRVGKVFVDGVDRTTTAGIANNFQNTAAGFVAHMGDQYYLLGEVDQIELASERRSPEWLATSFRNQNNPAAFYAVGAQELDPN